MRYVISFDIVDKRYKNRYGDVYGILEEMGAKRAQASGETVVESVWLLNSEHGNASSVLVDIVLYVTILPKALPIEALAFFIAPLVVSGKIRVLVNGCDLEVDPVKKRPKTV